MIILPELNSFDAVQSPQPSEGVKAVGADFSSYIINGVTATGDVRYVRIADGVRIRHLGGTSTALGVSISGNDVTVQLATSALSVVTSTANDVVNLINATPAVLLLLNAFVNNAPGTGIAGIWTSYMDLSGDLRGSIRPALQSLTNRTKFLVNYLVEQSLAPVVKAYKQDSLNTLKFKSIPSFLAYKNTLKTEIANSFLLPDVDYGAIYIEGGGGFVNNTAYFVYHVGLTNSIEFSTVSPTDDLLFKTGDVTKKYLMDFVTAGDATIPEFYRDGNRMYLMRGLGFVAGGYLFSGTIPIAPAEILVSATAYVPPTAKAIEFEINFDNNTLAAYRSVFVRAAGTGTGLKYEIQLPPWPAERAGGVSAGMSTVKIIMPVNDPGGKVIYLSSTTSAQLVTASVKMVGWIV